MPSDVDTGQSLYRRAEKDAVADIGHTRHCLVRRTVTLIRRLVGGECKVKPSASHRCKLPVLVNDAHDRAGKL